MGDDQSSSLNDQSFAETPTLDRTVSFITSLISLSHLITSFPSKWQSIRNKLAELSSDLAAVENCEISSLSFAIDPIFPTLRNCDDLARRCLEFSFTGKLRMQSDLDMLSAKLEMHTNSIANIRAAGLLTQSSAIVVSRPNASASRHDLQFYINDLLSRFKIGGGDVKKQALIAFNEAILDDANRYAKIAIEVDGFVDFLVKFLEYSDDCAIQQQAVKAVCSIAEFESCRGVLITAGIIPPLIRILELVISDEGSKELSLRCLMKVTENSNNAWAVSAHGGVTTLLKICGNGNQFGGNLVSLSCGVLKNLVGVEEMRRFMVEDGAVLVLVELVKLSNDEATLICAVDLLNSVACGDETVKNAIVKNGGIHALTKVLDPKLVVSINTREAAFRGITNICETPVASVLDTAFMDHIMYFLKYGEFPLQELGLKAAFWLCGTSEDATKLMGGAGFIPVLVKFLGSKSFEARELAGETLSGMMIVPKNCKIFVQSDENVGMLLQMLNPGEANPGDKKVLVSILMALASSSCGRKKIVRSQHLKDIEQKLAEAEVSDAKRVVRKLCCNNWFRSLWNGLRHFL